MGLTVMSKPLETSKSSKKKSAIRAYLLPSKEGAAHMLWEWWGFIPMSLQATRGQ